MSASNPSNNSQTHVIDDSNSDNLISDNLISDNLVSNNLSSDNLASDDFDPNNLASNNSTKDTNYYQDAQVETTIPHSSSPSEEVATDNIATETTSDAQTQPISEHQLDTVATASPTHGDTEASQDKPEMIPAQIKMTGRMLSFTRLAIIGNDVDEILTTTRTKLGKKLHSNLPIVVSCDTELNLAHLWDGLWELGLQPIGLVTGAMNEQAQALKIAIFPADGQRIDGKSLPAKSDTAKAESLSCQPSDETPATPTSSRVESESPTDDTNKLQIAGGHMSHLEGDMVHNQMLRSGQSINHVGGDLILTKGVNAGAEAITDYSLHIYGKAEGRLVAGATGDKNAKIFCTKFNPSLVSVAGTYCLKENIPTEFINQAVQVSYTDGQGLVFQLML